MSKLFDAYLSIKQYRSTIDLKDTDISKFNNDYKSRLSEMKKLKDGGGTGEMTEYEIPAFAKGRDSKTEGGGKRTRKTRKVGKHKKHLVKKRHSRKSRRKNTRKRRGGVISAVPTNREGLEVLHLLQNTPSTSSYGGYYTRKRK